MAYINAATAGNFATVIIKASAGTTPTLVSFITTGATPTVQATALEIPALQEITVTNNAGTFRWRELQTLSEKVVSTVSTNSVGGTLVVDPVSFFGTGGGSSTIQKGIFNLSNEKTPIDFVVFLSGYSVADRYIMGTGYMTKITPAVSSQSPVWTSPFQIEVDGDFIVGVIPSP
jgi:hypothetical protein